MVRVDLDLVRQLVINLVGNAIKFARAAFVELNLELGSGKEQSYVVRDTSIGIAPDELKTSFEVFTQADGSISRSYGGIGLGPV